MRANAFRQPQQHLTSREVPSAGYTAPMNARTSCDLLLTNAYVLTLDEQFKAHAPGSVAINAGAIVAVGNVEAEFEPRETVVKIDAGLLSC